MAIIASISPIRPIENLILSDNDGENWREKDDGDNDGESDGDDDGGKDGKNDGDDDGENDGEVDGENWWEKDDGEKDGEIDEVADRNDTSDMDTVSDSNISLEAAMIGSVLIESTWCGGISESGTGWRSAIALGETYFVAMYKL